MVKINITMCKLLWKIKRYTLSKSVKIRDSACEILSLNWYYSCSSICLKQWVNCHWIWQNEFTMNNFWVCTSIFISFSLRWSWNTTLIHISFIKDKCLVTIYGVLKHCEFRGLEDQSRLILCRAAMWFIRAWFDSSLR